MEERSMSWGFVRMQSPRVLFTTGFHGSALERSNSDSAQVAAPENCDLERERERERESSRGVKR